MDKASPAGWLVHAGMLGALVVVGIVATILDRGQSTSGAWISLRGVVAFLIWIGLGVYALASTLTFALLRERIGVVPSYLAALPITALLIGGTWGLRNELDRRRWQARDAEVLKRLSSRIELIGWSTSKDGDGVRVRAEIRALRDVEVRLDLADGPAGRASGEAPAGAARTKLAAGSGAVLEAVLRPSPARLELIFSTVAEDGPASIAYIPDFPYDSVSGDQELWRPLPPPK